MQELLRYMNPYTIAGAIIIVAAIALPVFVRMRRARQEARAAKRATEGDLANMMMLLQTMRDTLREQKELARKLNESLDKKVLFIRETVDAAMNDLDRLRTGVSDSATELAGLRERLEALRSETDSVRQRLAEAPRPAAEWQDAAPGGASARDEVPAPAPAPDPEPAAGQLDFGAIDAPLEVVARPERPEADASLLDNWVGLDLSEEEQPETRFPVPDETPQEPESPELAREAFRALLDLEDRKPAPAPAPSPAPAMEPAGKNAEGANGRAKLTPLQQRVYEYSDAGMSIAEIANEIGIGKGEVRLILSIRKERS